MEPCVFCALRNVTNIDMSRNYNRFLSVAHPLSTFYAFAVNHQEVQVFKADHFASGKARGVGLHLTASCMQHVLNTCVRQLILRNNYIVYVERQAIIRPGSLFNQCLQRLDLSYNAFFQMDVGSFFQLNHFSQLREFESAAKNS
jgi:hypothetical protein